MLKIPFSKDRFTVHLNADQFLQPQELLLLLPAPAAVSDSQESEQAVLNSPGPAGGPGGSHSLSASLPGTGGSIEGPDSPKQTLAGDTGTMCEENIVSCLVFHRHGGWGRHLKAQRVRPRVPVASEGRLGGAWGRARLGRRLQDTSPSSALPERKGFVRACV